MQIKIPSRLRVELIEIAEMDSKVIGSRITITDVVNRILSEYISNYRNEKQKNGV